MPTFSIPALLLVATVIGSSILPNTNARLAGSYRCQSVSDDGEAGFCRLYPPIVLKANGTYSMSSEKGSYKVSGDIIKLSESKLRGPGRIVDGNKIRFEYDYKGLRQVLTYLKVQTTASSSKDIKQPAQHVVEVNLSLIFPIGYGVDYFNVVDLVPPTDSKLPIYQSITYASDKRTLKVTYNTNKGVLSGYIYDIYASTGSDRIKAGTLDLRKTTQTIFSKEITVTP